MKKSLILFVLWLMVSFLLAGEGAFTNLESAIAKATEEKKDILVDFTGSDWCTWCVRLDNEVFSKPEWKTYAEKNLITVILDFPREKELPKEQSDYNRKIAEKYNIQGFPTICLLDSTGTIYAKTGYQQGGPSAYIQHIQKLAENKVKLQTLVEKVKTAQGEEKIKTVIELLDVADKNEIGFAFISYKDEAIQADPENKFDCLLKFSEQLVEYYGELMMKTEVAEEKATYLAKVDGYIANIKKFDANKAKNLDIRVKDIPRIIQNFLETEKWAEALVELEKVIEKGATGETAQYIYYFMALANFRTENKPGTIESLKKAIAVDPDNEISAKLKELLQNLEAEEKPVEEKPAEEKPVEEKPTEEPSEK